MINRDDAVEKHDVYKYGHIKADCIKLVSGVNCTAESACAEFISTKASYNKNSGVQFYHYTQSFKADENISPMQAHQIALEFAKKHYGDYEVLVATHIDNNHLHSHFIINSVSFHHGKKLRQSPSTLKMLRASSDEICQKYGFTTLTPYQSGRRENRGETKAQKKGTSWKFDLCLQIEKAMKKASTKAEFLQLLDDDGITVKWEDSRKYITYTFKNSVNGKVKNCRDNKLYGGKFLKENMQAEFDIRQNLLSRDVITGWEYERKLFANQNNQQQYKNKLSQQVGKEILFSIGKISSAQREDDEFAEITALAGLTGLSCVGAYVLVDLINKRMKECGKIALSELEKDIEDVRKSPENTMEFEEEQDFDMTMEGY